MTFAEQARDVFARAGDTEGESTALAQQATTLFNLGRYAEAQAALEETLPIFRRAGHRYREAINLGNLASIAMMRGHYANADRWAREALESARQLEEVEAGATYMLVLGAVETNTSRFDDAREHLLGALAVAHQVGANSTETDALARLVAVELGAGNLEAAIERAREAVAAGATVPSDLDRALAEKALGYAASAIGVWDEAESGFATSSDLFRSLELEPPVRECVVGLAGVAAGRGQLAEAVELLEPVLEHLDTDGLSGTSQPGLMLRTAHWVLSQAGDPRSAAVREQARTYLRTKAAEVGDPDLEAGFLAFPPHAELLAES